MSFGLDLFLFAFHLLLILFKPATPQGFIILQIPQILFHCRQHSRSHTERRIDNDIDKPNLALRDIDSAPVHEVTNRRAFRSLQIALVEELHEQQVNPLLAHLPGLCRVRYISQMEQHKHGQVFVHALGHVEVVRSCPRFELRTLGEVLGHVGREDATNHQGTGTLEVVLLEFVQYVEFSVRMHYCEGGSNVVIFKH